MYLFTDHKDTPLIGLDAVSKTSVWEWYPDAFGVAKPMLQTVKMSLRFSGQYYDETTDLHYNMNRYYNPMLGRYMEADPIGLEGGWTPYVYAENNPISKIDPTGEAIPVVYLFYAAGVAITMNDIGNGEPPGGSLAKAIGKQVIKSSAAQATKGAKRGPKTDPNAPHNSKITEIGNQIESDGGTVIAGGDKLPEQLIPTFGVNKSGRRPDILYKDCNGKTCGVNVGKAKADGNPIKREQEALDDLNNKAGIPTKFEPYN